MVFRSKWMAIGWLIFMSFLFIIPGSALPKEDWLSKIYFDKWVHIGLFAVLIFLWRMAFNLKTRNYSLILIFFALVYGTAIEFIQEQWVSNRSFDLFDICADLAGAIAGLIIWFRYIKK